MNVTETQQNYTNYQTQSSNSTTKTESKEEFLDILKNSESYKSEAPTNDKISQEEFNEKYKLGLQRYNDAGTAEDKWFKNSIFEKDQNVKNEFVKYLSELSNRDYGILSVNLWTSFGSGLVEDENGNMVAGNHKKDPSKEFSSIGSVINYFGDEIKDIEEGARKFGGDPSHIIELLTDVLNFFKNYQSKEQEEQYKTLGNNQNAN